MGLNAGITKKNAVKGETKVKTEAEVDETNLISPTFKSVESERDDDGRKAEKSVVGQHIM